MSLVREEKEGRLELTIVTGETVNTNVKVTVDNVPSSNYAAGWLVGVVVHEGNLLRRLIRGVEKARSNIRQCMVIGAECKA